MAVRRLSADEREAMGRRLMQAREARGVSQRQLSRLVGVAESATSGWESGKTSMCLGSLVKVCRALEVSSSAILGV